MSKTVVKQKMVVVGNYEHRNKEGRLISKGRISSPNGNILKKIYNFVVRR